MLLGALKYKDGNGSLNYESAPLLIGTRLDHDHP